MGVGDLGEVFFLRWGFWVVVVEMIIGSEKLLNFVGDGEVI